MQRVVVGKHRAAHYSRGIRQRLHTLAHKHRWRDRHKIVIGPREEASASEQYAQMLSSSRFCLVVPGVSVGPGMDGCILVCVCVDGDGQHL